MLQEMQELISQASTFLKANYKKNQHHVACALRCGNGIYFALHLDIKGFDVCAEPIALSNALYKKEIEFQAIVAVMMDESGNIEVVNPCGNCRQMLCQYTPSVQVLIKTREGIQSQPATKLLPWPYL